MVQEKKPTTTRKTTTKSTAANEKSSGRAIGALVCGICSIVIGTWCCFLWLPLGIIAMVLGKQEEKAIANGLAPESGKTLAQWGFWLGLVGVALGFLFSIIGLIFGVFTSIIEEYQG